MTKAKPKHGDFGVHPNSVRAKLTTASEEEKTRFFRNATEAGEDFRSMKQWADQGFVANGEDFVPDEDDEEY